MNDDARRHKRGHQARKRHLSWEGEGLWLPEMATPPEGKPDQPALHKMPGPLDHRRFIQKNGTAKDCCGGFPCGYNCPTALWATTLYATVTGAPETALNGTFSLGGTSCIPLGGGYYWAWYDKQLIPNTPDGISRLRGWFTIRVVALTVVSYEISFNWYRGVDIDMTFISTNNPFSWSADCPPVNESSWTMLGGGTGSYTGNDYTGVSLELTS